MKLVNLTHIQRDALLFKALLRKVFPQPRKGDFYFTPQLLTNPREFLIYLSDEYFEILKNALRDSYQAGKFSSSNAEDHWVDMMRQFDLAEDVESVDEFVGAIYTTVKDFLKGAKPDDDISILGVEFTGGKSNYYSI